MPYMFAEYPVGFPNSKEFELPAENVPVTEILEVVVHDPDGGKVTVMGVAPLKLICAVRGVGSPFT